MHHFSYRLLFLGFLLYTSMVHGQWRPAPEDLYQEAEDHFHYGEFDRALPLFLRLGTEETLSPFVKYRIGICYLHIPGKENLAIPYLEAGLDKVSPEPGPPGINLDKVPEDLHYYLGIAYRHTRETEKSIFHLDTFLAGISDPLLKESAEQEKDKTLVAELFRRNAEGHNRFELNAGHGLQDTDFNIVISSDGKSLVFSRPLKFYDALFYTSFENNSWQKFQNITPQIGSDGDAIPLSFSRDGQSLLLYRNDPATNGDIYLSRLERGRWTKMEKLPDPVNTKYYESHASFSADGKQLYFSSNRPGGYGGLDIYHTAMDEKGNWTEPLNLGIGVNTLEDEITPWVSEDENYMIFSSKGHTGMGGYDVFVSRRSDDGLWLQARNPGYPLNTSGQDRFFVPSADLGSAWYESFVYDQPVKGRLIGVRNFFPLREGSPEIEIRIASWHKELPLSNPFLSVMDLRTTQLVRKETFPAEKNILKLELEPGFYEIIVTADRYGTVRRQVSIDYYYPGDVQVGVSLDPQQSTVEIGEIYFAFDRFVPDASELKKLDDLLALLRDYPFLKVSVSGYTDITGSAVYNKLLAGRRANAVKDHMVSEGIPASRILVNAVGADHFIAPNNTPEGRMLNRRVEAEIINCPDFIQVKLIR